MIQCNSCKVIFESFFEMIVPDQTGFDDKSVPICPTCEQQTEQTLLIFTEKNKKILTYWADAFISQCNRQKMATNEIFLLEHYTKLILETQQLLKILTK